MKNFRVPFFCLALLLCASAQAASSWCAKPQAVQSGESIKLSAAGPLGKEITQSVNLATGAAINPLLVVGGLGAWCWLDTPSEQRAQLPWHQRPWYWAPLLTIALLYLLGTLIGIVAPGSNKFTEAARTLEGHLQPLYTLPVLLPLIYGRFGGGIEQLHYLLAWMIPSAQASGTEPTGSLALLPVAMALVFALIYGVVWLTTLAVNALVLLSPFPFLDALIRAAHFAYVAALLLLSVVSPWLGLLLALPLVILALVVSGWCLRLSVFATIIATDLLFFWRKRPAAVPLLSFAGYPLEGVPARTCGTLQRDAGQLVFHYRPWLILPKRSIRLEDREIMIERGVLYPRLRACVQGGIVTRIAFPPRYCGQEESVARQLGITRIDDGAVLSGWTAVKAWAFSFSGNAGKA
ncbi:MAG: hypothetical protein BWY57_00664 [Betaproteobacteria bacterium ADurb.Bin341]|nr:MAG: hypothetical protein BWY57_00664 [Betaproteobacteria bacterium ADurb.Bin341]